jgi:GMP synthase (glutamine-hydrolysing)
MTRVVAARLHADFGPGLLARWAESRGVALDTVCLDRGERLPGLDAADAVVVLGSYASLAAHGPSTEPVGRLRRWVAEALARDVPVLGIGYGAQLVASILGGGAGTAERPEAGWIRLTTRDPALAPGPWLSWHGDYVVPPPSCALIAFNAHGAQAFRVGPHLAVQFHPEATAGHAGRWAAAGHLPAPADVVPESLRRAGTAIANAQALFDGWAGTAGLPVACDEGATPA